MDYHKSDKSIWDVEKDILKSLEACCGRSYLTRHLPVMGEAFGDRRIISFCYLPDRISGTLESGARQFSSFVLPIMYIAATLLAVMIYKIRKGLKWE